MKGAKNVSGLIDSRTQYGRPGAGAPGQSGMCRHIFSHPDYDRRLWHLTRSADPDVREGRRALAGSPHCMAYRRWGIAPRPEDVLHVVLTTFWIVRLSGFCVGICLLQVRDLDFGDAGGRCLRRLARGRAGGRGSTIAVRSLRSGLPLRHLRHCLWQFLQIPLGASTPRAPRPAPAPGSGFDTSPPLGRGVCLAFFCRAVWRWRILRGRQKRPRGRPFLALGCLAGAGGAARGWGRVSWRWDCLYFAVAGVFAAVADSAVSAASTTFAVAGVSAFFFFFFGSASIVPRHGGVPHRQR